jgi:RNA polymerase sigma-70 factor (ECF subfamily)
VEVIELARVLGLGFETAKSRLRYALQKLKGCMQAYLSPWEAA